MAASLVHAISTSPSGTLHVAEAGRGGDGRPMPVMGTSGSRRWRGSQLLGGGQGVGARVDGELAHD